MLSYAIRRLLGAIPTLFFIVTAAFFMMRVAPGGPFDQERTLEATVMANLNKTFGLDRPLHEQYLLYLGNLLRGDMGPSFVYRDFKVHELLGSGLPVSIQLGFSALVLAFVVGAALGCVAALRQNTPVDYAVIAIATFGITVPNFVVAPTLALIFAIWWDLLPAGGWESWSLKHMTLPVITLALPQIAVVARLIRGAMIEALRSDHVRTARAYGLPTSRIVVYHALRPMTIACLLANTLTAACRQHGLEDPRL